MKKILLMLMMTLTMMFVSGCGSNDFDINTTITGGDGTEQAPTNGFYNATTPLQISQPNASYQIKAQIVKDGYASPDRIVKVKAFPEKYGYISNMTATTGADGYATFDYKSPDALPVSGTHVYVQLINDENGTVITQNIELVFKSTSSNPTNGFFNATTPMQITQKNTKYEIKAQILKDGFAAPGKEVKVKAFPRQYGSIKNMSAVTGDDGYAIFTYESPITLPPSGTRTKIQLVNDDNGSVITQDIELAFKPTGLPPVPPVDTTGMKLAIAPDTMSVSQPDERVAINTYLYTNDGPVANIRVRAQWFDPNLGTLESYTANTNTNGQAVFGYIAPKSLPASNLHITFDVENPTASIASIATIKFGTSSSSIVNTTGMTLQAVPNVLNIDKSSKEKVIGLFLSRDTGGPVSDVEIKANWFDPAKGTLDTYLATTNKNGQAVFKFMPPLTLPSEGLTMIFDVSNPTSSIATSVEVRYEGSDVPPTDTTDMTITAAPDTINVYKPNTAHMIDVYLSKKNSPVEGIQIVAHWFDPNNGVLNTYAFVTEPNGHAQFEYTAPKSLPTSDLGIVFDVDSATASIAKTVTVKFDHGTYSIAPKSKITVGALSQEINIDVGLYRQQAGGTKEAAVGKTIIAEYIMPENGQLASYELEVSSGGVATFKYTSPSDKLPSDDINITFYFKDDHSVMGKTRVHFDPGTIDTVSDMYVAPENLTITKGGQEENITIITVNSRNVGISAEVQIEQPNNGTDYGSIDQTRLTTDLNGVAHVVYTAPANIDDLTERNITITEKGQNITKTLHIKFNKLNQSTKYEIIATTPDSLSIESSDHLGIKIVKANNHEQVIPDNKVHEVNLTSKFQNMLVFDSDRPTFKYDKLGSNEGIALYTKKLSGVAVVKVSASINDGTNDVVITKNVPVTILSGPVTTMSLSYITSYQKSTEDDGLFVCVYTIHAVDKYNNPARAGVPIHPTLVNGTKIPLNYHPEPIPNRLPTTGEIKNGSPVTINDSTLDFVSKKVETTDRAIIVTNPNHNDQAYLGDWSLDTVYNHELQVSEKYYGPDESGLSYVIGNDKRYIEPYGIASADAVSPTGGYLTDGNGTVQFEVKFDPILAGHTVTLAANAYDGNRTGISKIENLRWGHYTTSVVVIPNDGADHNVTLSLGIASASDQHLEPLLGLHVTKDSIVSDTSACAIDIVHTTYDDLYTGTTGTVQAVINTHVTGVDATECKISWHADNGDIYREYF